MEKTLRVLSVDFDFFQRVSADTVQKCYPDGRDLSPALSLTVWHAHLSVPQEAEKIRKVTVDRKRMEQLKKIIRRQDPSIPVMVVQSHVHIYHFILSHMAGYSRCDITNIDMHHDMFNGNPTLDCGNWISHIKQAIPKCKITWIANRTSEEAYGLKGLPVKYELDELMDRQFDLLFLCRSDAWLPPHLDDRFLEVLAVIRRTFPKMTTDGMVLYQRE